MYIIKFFFPFKLSALYQYPTLEEFNNGSFGTILLLTLAATIIIAILVILSMKKTRLFAFGIGFYLVTIALVLQFITVGMAIMAERYSYLPYVGLSMIPAILIADSKKATRNIMLIIAGSFLVMLMILSGNQTGVWKSTETLWSKVIDKHPQLELPRRSRGKYYSKKALQAKTSTEKKNYEDKALADFLIAIKAGTKSADVFEGTGTIYGARGEQEKAILLLNAAIKINPRKGSAYFNRAIVYGELDRKEEAISDYNMALIYRPQLAVEIANNRSNLLVETGKFREAILDFNYLISVDGTNFRYYFNRGYAKIQLNDIPGAIADYRKALQLKPDDKILQDLLNALSKTYPGY
jgi:tetratricopeptide (TPR) repeat protein